MEFEFEDEPKSGDRSNQMGQESPRSNIVDTTDCLEAVSVIRCWKNLLFIIILLALLLLQVLFWLQSLNLVKPDETPGPIAATSRAGEIKVDVTGPQALPDRIKQAAKVAAEPNQVLPQEFKLPLQLKTSQLMVIVRFLDFILIPASMLFCLTMLFSLKVSLIGRLGGINHIARAFFLSLLFVVLLLPWQILFAPVFAGAMFTPTELINACAAEKTPFANVCLYLRFSGYWLFVMLLFLSAQVRSMRWARATLRRLEVV
jgi:hypothetical protein